MLHQKNLFITPKLAFCIKARFVGWLQIQKGLPRCILQATYYGSICKQATGDVLSPFPLRGGKAMELQAEKRTESGIHFISIFSNTSALLPYTLYNHPPSFSAGPWFTNVHCEKIIKSLTT